ncbi:MAG: recj: single-stranded-dna-specific exonuclease recj [Verrucomicrobiales bacterium]|nr:recj: single-stranded-dna-specific exonuclease recj [Verrucomicrobiales bacterium]
MAAPTQWILRPAQTECLESLNACGLVRAKSVLVRRLLAQRGIGGGEAAERFLNPRLKELGDPFLLPDMDKAVDRLLQAVDRQEAVVLYGDYDVDGVTSLTLLHDLLKAYGLKVRCFLPLRMEEGYGMTGCGLERCLAEGETTLLVAVDCGTTSKAETAWLADQGIEVIVMDHHEPDPDRLPEAVAVVNPKRGGGWHYLCSAGVVFKVAHAMGKRRRLPHFDLKSELDLVALATVADIMPLVEENRLLVRQGLDRLGSTRRVGLRALIEVSGIHEPYTSMDLGFRLGPRLNAAGRLDTAHAALDLLLCRDIQEARDIARDLDLQNRERQTLEQRIQAEALTLASQWMEGTEPLCSLVVASRGWHPGVVGIVAARLMRQFYRPVFVIAIDDEGNGKGSGRSVPGVSLVAALDSCRPLLLGGGGHEMAAGVTVREENLEAFRQGFHEHVRRQINGGKLEPHLYVDAETRLEELTMGFLEDYDQLQPFGNSNPQPVFMARGVYPSAEPRLLRERHWRLEVIQDGTMRTAMWFNAGDQTLPPPPWDIAFHVDRNVFRGHVSVQLLVQALRPSVSFMGA